MSDLSLSAADGKQQFLQLLVTQLQHQDPLSPMEQTDFLTQLAQFSSLEAMQQLNVRFSDMLALQQLTQGSSLLGRTVTFDDPATGQPQTGVVNAARIDGDKLVVRVGNYELELKQLKSVQAQ